MSIYTTDSTGPYLTTPFSLAFSHLAYNCLNVYLGNRHLTKLFGDTRLNLTLNKTIWTLRCTYTYTFKSVCSRVQLKRASSNVFFKMTIADMTVQTLRQMAECEWKKGVLDPTLLLLDPTLLLLDPTLLLLGPTLLLLGPTLPYYY